jgi:hypothetical protein
MNNALVVRLGIALVGVVTFLYGVREGQDRVRWLGVGFVAIAWILRFWHRRPVPQEPPEPEPE